MPKSCKTNHVDPQQLASGQPGDPPTSNQSVFYDLEQPTRTPRADADLSQFDELDRLMTSLAGRLGIHPAELAALRYGDTGSNIHPRETERNLRQNLAGETPLGQLALRCNLLTEAEAAWLDRRERPTVVRVASDAGASLVMAPEEDNEGPHIIAPVQYVGNGLGRFWQATEQRIASRLAPQNVLDFGILGPG